MESLSFDSKAKMGSMNLESKPSFIFENNMVFSHNAISTNQGFGETCFPEIIGNSFLSPTMCATHNEVLEEHESSSGLSSSVVDSNGLFDLIKHVPSKQKRITGFNSSSPLCKVHGCNKSLVFCKDYHRRHKVCELHSKTAKVIVNGIEQRFCQQCSRFHLLSEFDEGKRSCRKRLADHNQRRRKPHSSHHGRLLPPYNPKGSKFKGSRRTMAKASSTCNDLRSMSSVTDIQHYPSLCENNNASSSVLFKGVKMRMDSTCALSLLSTQSHDDSSSHSFNQNTHQASGIMSNNMNPLPLVVVDSEYINSENRLWCEDENDMSTADWLQLSSQLERVELHKEIVRSNSQNNLQ